MVFAELGRGDTLPLDYLVKKWVTKLPPSIYKEVFVSTEERTADSETLTIPGLQEEAQAVYLCQANCLPASLYPLDR